MAFNKFAAKLDPTAGLDGPWLFRIRLAPGVSMVSPTITPVDGSDAPLSSGITVSNLVATMIDAGSNLWGVSVYLLSDGTQGFYNLRCRYSTDGSPSATRDRTMRVEVAQN